MRISDRITVLRDGKLVTTLANNDQITENDLINNMVGRDLSGSLYKIKTVPGNTDGSVVLEVKGLSKKNALNATDVTLRKGELLGVFGLEGSGTTKLSRMMYGLEHKDTGEITVRGKKINTVNPRNMIRENVMYLNNNRKLAGLLLDMAVTDNLSLPILSQISDKLGFINFRNREKNAMKYVDKFSIMLSSLKTRPRNLSGGNQQKVMLSMCLVSDPEILIVNEPTRGIDVGAKTEIQKFLFEIAAKGVGIMVFSSELPELMSLCDRILVMRNNSIAGELSCGEYTEQAIMRYATVGTL
jgi:ABC-type sugar transport system ATPase subunit